MTTRQRVCAVIAALAITLAGAIPASATPSRNTKCCPNDPTCILVGGSYHPSCKSGH